MAGGDDMASERFEKGSEMWQMFTDFWKLSQSLWQVEQTDDYWQDAYDECRAFGDKYSGLCGDFAKSLAISLLNYLDTRIKLGR